jgi:hypothetical protein
MKKVLPLCVIETSKSANSAENITITRSNFYETVMPGKLELPMDTIISSRPAPIFKAGRTGRDE